MPADSRTDAAERDGGVTDVGKVWEVGEPDTIDAIEQFGKPPIGELGHGIYVRGAHRLPPTIEVLSINSARCSAATTASRLSRVNTTVSLRNVGEVARDRSASDSKRLGYQPEAANRSSQYETDRVPPQNTMRPRAWRTVRSMSARSDSAASGSAGAREITRSNVCDESAGVLRLTCDPRPRSNSRTLPSRHRRPEPTRRPAPPDNGAVVCLPRRLFYANCRRLPPMTCCRAASAAPGRATADPGPRRVSPIGLRPCPFPN